MKEIDKQRLIEEAAEADRPKRVSDRYAEAVAAATRAADAVNLPGGTRKYAEAALEAEKAAKAAKQVTDQYAGARAMAEQIARGEVFGTLGTNQSLCRMLDDLEKHRTLMRSIAAPFEEYRRLGVFDTPSLISPGLQQARDLIAEYSNRFTLPEMSTLARLTEEFQANPLSKVMERYAEQAAGLTRAMEAMRTPWMDAADALRSIGGFAGLQGIGKMLDEHPPFDLKASNILRIDLGDWRDPITWPKDIFTDLGARANFYVGLGFDPALTDLPPAAFQQSVEIAGLRREPPQMVKEYGAPVPPAEDADEEFALHRTNEAHDWLMRLEMHIRRFIDYHMTREFGADWPKHRLPGDLYDQWRQRKQAAEDAGRGGWPLIAFADFTDYERVICKRDNWRQVFGSFFPRPETVRETFQRLYPIRIDTMHARPIGQDDELLLYVETRQWVKLTTF